MCFPNINRTQAAEIDLDLQTHPNKGRNTSSVTRVNLAQINSAIPEISTENAVFRPL